MACRRIAPLTPKHHRQPRPRRFARRTKLYPRVLWDLRALSVVLKVRCDDCGGAARTPSARPTPTQLTTQLELPTAVGWRRMVVREGSSPQSPPLESQHDSGAEQPRTATAPRSQWPLQRPPLALPPLAMIRRARAVRRADRPLFCARDSVARPTTAAARALARRAPVSARRGRALRARGVRARRGSDRRLDATQLRRGLDVRAHDRPHVGVRARLPLVRRARAAEQRFGPYRGGGYPAKPSCARPPVRRSYLRRRSEAVGCPRTTLILLPARHPPCDVIMDRLAHHAPSFSPYMCAASSFSMHVASSSSLRATPSSPPRALLSGTRTRSSTPQRSPRSRALCLHTSPRSTPCAPSRSRSQRSATACSVTSGSAAPRSRTNSAVRRARDDRKLCRVERGAKGGAAALAMVISQQPRRLRARVRPPGHQSWSSWFALRRGGKRATWWMDGGVLYEKGVRCKLAILPKVMCHPLVSRRSALNF